MDERDVWDGKDTVSLEFDNGEDPESNSVTTGGLKIVGFVLIFGIYSSDFASYSILSVS